MVSQDRPNVESWLREPNGAWLIVCYTGMEAIAKVRCLGIEIPLTEIYSRVEWAGGQS